MKLAAPSRTLLKAETTHFISTVFLSSFLTDPGFLALNFLLGSILALILLLSLPLKPVALRHSRRLRGSSGPHSTVYFNIGNFYIDTSYFMIPWEINQRFSKYNDEMIFSVRMTHLWVTPSLCLWGRWETETRGVRNIEICWWTFYGVWILRAVRVRDISVAGQCPPPLPLPPPVWPWNLFGETSPNAPCVISGNEIGSHILNPVTL